MLINAYLKISSDYPYKMKNNGPKNEPRGTPVSLYRQCLSLENYSLVFHQVFKNFVFEKTSRHESSDITATKCMYIFLDSFIQNVIWTLLVKNNKNL